MVGSVRRDAYEQFRALPRGGLQAEASSHLFGAFTHHAQTDMLLHSGGGHIWIKSPPIVMDGDARPAVLHNERDSHAAGIGVFADVGERFLQDAQELRLNQWFAR